jgi:hypothetical protein
MKFKLWAFCAMHALCVGYVFAADAEKSSWSLQLHGLSWHASDPPHESARKWNEFNVGLGLRYTHSDDWSTQFGLYKNSNNQTTAYAVAQYVPLRIGPMRGGVFAGLASGYRKIYAAGFMATIGAFSVRVIPAFDNRPTSVGIELGVPL